MNIEVVINVWAGGQRIFDMLLPFWEAHNCPMLVFCPTDSKVNTHHDMFSAGRAGQAGPQTFIRWQKEIEFMSNQQQFDAFVVFEYDSLSLDPRLTIKPGLVGIDAPNLQGDVFMCDRYVVPPWAMDRETVDKLYQASVDHPEIFEGGFDDRLLCAWAKVAVVPVLDHDHPFHAPGGGATILPNQYAALADAVKNGATMIHGVKTQQALDVAVGAYRQRDR